MDVKLALCQMIGQSTGMGNDLHELNEKDIVHKQKLCMEILNVANIISPGNCFKGLVFDCVWKHKSNLLYFYNNRLKNTFTIV